ncbi:hypothetical protein NQ314_013323 [Rhamnusium bicolor]|uniref:Uncharacterized protein n=1 Tax=Rhamnusium bicolor TaxID=1586634 RepID=A0AAV8X7B8_9CUCU|nr:hypothetical protein NQ314_013323 [Rhamnusium bicolor]
MLNTEYEHHEVQEIIYEDQGDEEGAIHYVIEEQTEYEENTEPNSEYNDESMDYTYEEENEELVDNPPEEEVGENAAVDINAADIKREDELVACDICQKSF